VVKQYTVSDNPEAQHHPNLRDGSCYVHTACAYTVYERYCNQLQRKQQQVAVVTWSSNTLCCVLVLQVAMLTVELLLERQLEHRADTSNAENSIYDNILSSDSILTLRKACLYYIGSCWLRI
jgi:hypothetical protein